ncbi:hypothetical protein GCM10011289_27840 [Paludibacterium paludis]|uniref:Uncharacterized protein n=1 Tax=Paludibacterium paludis TaxID=1225769 RepID=A0A918P5B9_9NEIS|nr:hypothetical protein GCM10011289_27840 [Paludibacterium paludis]
MFSQRANNAERLAARRDLGDVAIVIMAVLTAPTTAWQGEISLRPQSRNTGRVFIMAAMPAFWISSEISMAAFQVAT